MTERVCVKLSFSLRHEKSLDNLDFNKWNFIKSKINHLTKDRVIGRLALKLFSGEEGLGLLPTLIS